VVGGEAADGLGVPSDDEEVVGLDRPVHRPAVVSRLDADQGERRVLPQIECRPLASDIGGAGPDPQPEHAVLEQVLLGQGVGVAAQVGREHPHRPFRQQPPAEQHHHRDRARQQRDPDQGELEEAEAADPGVGCRLGHQHVHRGAGQGQHRPGVGGERQWQQQPGGELVEPHGHDHDHWQQGRHSGVDADQRGQAGDQHHHEDQQAPPAGTGQRGELPPSPGGHPPGVQALADHEQRRDEDHCRVTEAGEGLVQVEDPGGPQGERGAEGHQLDGEPVPDEQDDHGGEYREADRDVAHATPRLTSRAGYAPPQSPQPSRVAGQLAGGGGEDGRCQVAGHRRSFPCDSRSCGPRPRGRTSDTIGHGDLACHQRSLGSCSRPLRCNWSWTVWPRSG
jgi:hypothetical protein